MQLPNFLPYDLALATAITLTVLAALALAKAFIARQLRRFARDGQLEFLSYPEQLLAATRAPFLIGVSLLAGLSFVELPAVWNKGLQYAWTLVLVTQAAMWGSRLVEVTMQRAVARQRERDPSAATHLMLGGMVIRVVVWSVAALVALDNLGFNISTLMASLGIGGIAVALAVQNILGDIFSSVSIALDKPFVIGDFIIVDDYLGTVEYIGMKTTRLRSLGGEQIVISNAELLKNRIRNYKRMQERRVVLEFGIAYDTPMQSVELVPTLVREAVDASPHGTRFDRAHFKGFKEGALLYEVVYYVLDPDYNKHMDVQQAVLLAVLRELRQRDIPLAHPTRTLHVAQAMPVQVAPSVFNEKARRA